jgi:hypothetical protein
MAAGPAPGPSPDGRLDIPVIGIRGVMGAGKDTLAAIIMRDYPEYAPRKFASKLRAVASVFTEIPVAAMESAADKAATIGPIELTVEEYFAREARAALVVGIESPPPCYALRVLAPDEPPPDAMHGVSGERFGRTRIRLREVTVGRLLQLLGTDCFRRVFGPTVWVDALFAHWTTEGRPPIVIADTRFPEETAAIRAAGGVVVEVRRRSAVRDDGRTAAHISESALVGEEPDCVIENDGSLEDLAAAFAATVPGLRDAARRRQS